MVDAYYYYYKVGSGKLKEWLPLEVVGSEAPKIRLAHPVTTMQGTRKRRRTASTDFLWSSGDRIDAWMQNQYVYLNEKKMYLGCAAYACVILNTLVFFFCSWREGVVMETSKLDATSLTVKFPGI